jgi:hypothetical protein
MYRASVFLRNRQDRSVLEKARNVIRPCAAAGIDFLKPRLSEVSGLLFSSPTTK